MKKQQDTKPLLSVQELTKHFPLDEGLLDTLKFRKGRITRERRAVHAVNGVSLDVQRGEALCVVGESGCGKTTLARLVAGLLTPTVGEIYYDGNRIDNLHGSALLPYRKKMQMIFQNPYASLNPRMTIKQALEEPLKVHQPTMSTSALNDRTALIIKSVGINPDWVDRYPHEFSGGQRQRIAIARALMIDPEFLIADEPISALDVSIQAQVLNLMLEAKEQFGLTYLFITHDLAVVEHFATRVAVFYLGSLCELSDTATLFENPKHPYTKALLSAVPRLKGKRSGHIKLDGEIPTPIDIPKGCPFQTRCPNVDSRCRIERPALIQQADGSQVACHAVEENRLALVA